MGETARRPLVACHYSHSAGTAMQLSIHTGPGPYVPPMHRPPRPHCAVPCKQGLSRQRGRLTPLVLPRHHLQNRFLSHRPRARMTSAPAWMNAHARSVQRVSSHPHTVIFWAGQIMGPHPHYVHAWIHPPGHSSKGDTHDSNGGVHNLVLCTVAMNARGGVGASVRPCMRP